MESLLLASTEDARAASHFSLAFFGTWATKTKERWSTSYFSTFPYVRVVAKHVSEIARGERRPSSLAQCAQCRWHLDLDCTVAGQLKVQLAASTRSMLHICFLAAQKQYEQYSNPTWCALEVGHVWMQHDMYDMYNMHDATDINWLAYEHLLALDFSNFLDIFRCFLGLDLPYCRNDLQIIQRLQRHLRHPVQGHRM